MEATKPFSLFALTISLLAPTVHAGEMGKAKLNYDRYCASCHGFNGMSNAPGTPNLRMNEGLMQPDFQIIQKLKQGSSKKPPMLGIMSDKEFQDVISYSRTIR